MNPVMTGRRALALLLATTLAGCTVGPDYKPDKMAIPSQFNDVQANAVSAAWTQKQMREWWAQLNDPVLDHLVDLAITGNYDLRASSARLLAAREMRARDVAGLSPQVTAGAQWGDAKYSTGTEYPPGLESFNTFTRFWGFSINVDWELDLFGRIGHIIEARDAQVQALEAQRQGILVAAVAELVSDYASLRAAQARREVAEGNLKVTQDSLTLVQRLYARGLATSLQTAQAQTEVDNARAVISPLDTVATQARDAIAVLLGRAPEALGVDLTTTTAALPTPPPLPAALPSLVVANRPDIRAAERRYAEATAMIGVAVAQLYPDFSIPLAVDPSSAMLRTLFAAKSLAWSAMLSATQSIYTGGRLTAQIKEARAEAEFARLDYEHTVIKAFADVDDRVAAYRNETLRQKALADAVRDSAAQLDRSQRLYAAGLSGYLDVLSAQRSAYAARDARIQSQLAELQDAVGFYRALGAGWQGIALTETTLPVAKDEQARWAKHWRLHL